MLTLSSQSHVVKFYPREYLCNILRPVTYFADFFEIADLAINEQQLQYPNYVKALKVWPMSDGQTQKLSILRVWFLPAQQ